MNWKYGRERYRKEYMRTNKKLKRYVQKEETIIVVKKQSTMAGSSVSVAERKSSKGNNRGKSTLQAKYTNIGNIAAHCFTSSSSQERESGCIRHIRCVKVCVSVLLIQSQKWIPIVNMVVR